MTLNRIAGLVEAESAAQDIRILKLYRLWEEAKEILVLGFLGQQSEESTKPMSIFQQILYETYGQTGSDTWSRFQQYLNPARPDSQEGLVAELRELMGKTVGERINQKHLIGLSLDDHIPDEEAIKFILEQYSYLCLYYTSQGEGE